MSSDLQEKKEKKKGRKRVKAIHAKIKEQMEFYFSDSNLHKDRFLKKAIEATTDGYIELSTFLQFNRIKALTDEVKVVGDAIAYKSELLQINEDRTKVKRIKPLSELRNIDERTVYVEYLPNTADHEWVKKVFSVCGKVSYVSLPKYQTTGDLKGFGFVEFETEEAAKMACEELNNPPVEAGPRIGMFPKSSKPLEALKKKLPEDQIRESEEKVKMEVQCETGDITDLRETECSEKTKETIKPDITSEIASGILVKRVKRRRTKSEGSVEESFSDSSPQKRKKHEVSFDLPEDNDKGASGGKKKSKKRKNRSKTVDTVSVPHDSDKTESDKSDKTELLKSDHSEEFKESPAKRRKDDKESSKRKSDIDSEIVPGRKKLNLDVEKDNQSKDSDNLAGKKRKLDIKSEDTVKDADDKTQKKRRRQSSRESSVSQSDNEIEKKAETQSKTEVGTNSVGGESMGKKKKSRRRRKQHKQKEVPELRVIPKTEWLCLREEYLKLQKASMTMLKRTLAEMNDKTNTSASKEGEKKKRNEIEFVPDVIVKVISEKPMVRKTLKSELGGDVAVAYIDVKDGLCEGHIRCQDGDSAKQINSQKIDGYSFSLVTGNEEKVYWDKLVADREGKLSNKSRHKKRGHEKWMEKAQKASIENVERKHIIFDDD